jgi:pantoate kinase
METHKFEDSVYFHASCSCGWDKHAHEIEVKRDDGIGEVTVGINGILDAHDGYLGRNIFEKIWWRIRTAVRVLFIGRVEVGAEFLFENANQVDDYLAAVKKAMVDLKG